jgi:hypothetical protein
LKNENEIFGIAPQIVLAEVLGKAGDECEKEVYRSSELRAQKPRIDG